MLFEIFALIFSIALGYWYLYSANNANGNSSTSTTRTEIINTARSSNFTDTENMKTARSNPQFSICSTSSLAPLTSKHDHFNSPVQFTENDSDLKSTKTLPSISQNVNEKSEKWPVSTVEKAGDKEKKSTYV